MGSSTTTPPNDSSPGLEHQNDLEEREKLRTSGDHETSEHGTKESNGSNDIDSALTKRSEGTVDDADQDHQNDLEEREKLRTSGDHETSEHGTKESNCSNDIESSPPKHLEGTVDNSDQAIREATERGEFLGENDPEDPLNWPIWKKTYHTLVVSFYCLCVTFGSSVYTPGVFAIEKEFHVSSTVALLGLSLFILGFAFGPMIAAPISEKYGRRVVYWASLPFFAAFTLGSALAPNNASLAVFRFLSAVFGSPPLSVGAGTNADLFRPSSRALATGVFVLAPFLGPALGPIIGGYVAQIKGWRWTQWTQLFFAGAAFVSSLFMSETYKKSIIKKRAKRLGLAITKTEPQGIAKVKMLFTVTLFGPFKMLYTEPIVILFSIYVAFNFSVVYVFFDSFPIIFGGVYHFSLGEIGLTFLGLAFGCVLAVMTFIGVDRITYQKLYRKSLQEGRKGVVAPEHRLYSAMVGSLGMPIGLFWAAWTSRADVHWISPVLAAVPFGWGNLSVFVSKQGPHTVLLSCLTCLVVHFAYYFVPLGSLPLSCTIVFYLKESLIILVKCSVVLYLVDAYGMRNGASALAANGLLRYILAPAFPLFTIQMYNNLGIAWATSLFAFIALAMMPIPWVLFKWGPTIRNRSVLTLKIFEDEQAECRDTVSADLTA